MKKIAKKASTILYVLILVNIALILWISIYNYSITVSNDLSVKTNEDEMYRNIYDKWNIALKSTRKFNINWDGFTDFISCPTNVTMSGSNNKKTGILTEMAYNHGTIYCKWDYNWDEFRIYFNIDKTDYDSAYYKWDLVKLKFETSAWTPVLWSTNIAQGLPVSSSITATFNSADKWNTNDWDEDTEYVSWKQSNKKANLDWTFDSWDKYIWKIEIIKRYHGVWSWWSSDYWDEWFLAFFDSSWNKVITDKEIVWARTWGWWIAQMFFDAFSWTKKVKITVNLDNAWKTNLLHRIRLRTKNKNKYLDIFEIKMYEYTTIWWWDQHRIWKREFNDSDTTLISFDTQGTGWWDDIDDNMNSDNYKGSSTGTINYAFGYEDDDVLPRKTFWWNIPVWYKYYNIFWNNYKTADFIDNNPYNSLWHSKKISEVWTGYIYLDTYNTDNTDTSTFDLKIIQFDKQAYKDMNTLLPINSWEGKGIDNFVWYIQLSSTWNLSLEYYKTGNEFPFNFKDYDYSIFVTNKNSSGDISYILTAETESWTGIYINPINDSLSWTIEVMANHMLMGWEKNFIWDNFIVVWIK